MAIIVTRQLRVTVDSIHNSSICVLKLGIGGPAEHAIASRIWEQFSIHVIVRTLSRVWICCLLVIGGAIDTDGDQLSLGGEQIEKATTWSTHTLCCQGNNSDTLKNTITRWKCVDGLDPTYLPRQQFGFFTKRPSEMEVALQRTQKYEWVGRIES